MPAVSPPILRLLPSLQSPTLGCPFHSFPKKIWSSLTLHPCCFTSCYPTFFLPVNRTHVLKSSRPLLSQTVRTFQLISQHSTAGINIMQERILDLFYRRQMQCHCMLFEVIPEVITAFQLITNVAGKALENSSRVDSTKLDEQPLNAFRINQQI